MRQTCATRALKVHREKLRLRGSPPRGTAPGAVEGSLFAGTLHFLQLVFVAGDGSTFGLGPSDHSTAVAYATRVAPHTQAYASQYGANQVRIDPVVVPLSVTLPASNPSSNPAGAAYTDSDLRGWLDAYAQQQAVPGTDAIGVFNPPTGVENTDAPVSQGVLGYHQKSSLPYLFVNALGVGLTVDDRADRYAVALSHELAELVVDPAADLTNPEVGDPCSGNCGPTYRSYFDANDAWIGADATFPTTRPYAYFMNGIVRPAEAHNCPASAPACAYPPPT